MFKINDDFILGEDMWYIILGLITAIYLLTNILQIGLFGSIFGSYILRPIIWIFLAIITYIIARYEEINILYFKKIRKWDIGRNPFEAALLIGGFQISILIIVGLFVGFGESPYSHSMLGIITNLFFIISLLFGIELSRSYFVKKGTTKRGNVTLILGLMAILFMLIQISPLEFTVLNFSEPITSIKFIGERIIPLLAMSLFASYLAYVGGAISAIGYMGILKIFEWFSPVLPDLDWALAALIGTIAPAIGFLIIQNSIESTLPKAKKIRRKAKTKDPTIGWTIVAIISVIMVFFTFGYFGVQPTVIYSGSMQPVVDIGDIVIISDVSTDSIKEGDIIQFKNTNISIPILHRVYKIDEKGDTKLFITKGDANNDPDTDPIISNQIMGKAIFTIPKIGWIPITMKSLVGKIGINL